jgi:hypothetical protein
MIFSLVHSIPCSWRAGKAMDVGTRWREIPHLHVYHARRGAPIPRVPPAHIILRATRQTIRIIQTTRLREHRFLCGGLV